MTNVSQKTLLLAAKRCPKSTLKAACDRAIVMPCYRAILTPPKSMLPSDFDAIRKAWLHRSLSCLLAFCTDQNRSLDRWLHRLLTFPKQATERVWSHQKKHGSIGCSPVCLLFWHIKIDLSIGGSIGRSFGDKGREMETKGRQRETKR